MIFDANKALDKVLKVWGTVVVFLLLTFPLNISFNSINPTWLFPYQVLSAVGVTLFALMSAQWIINSQIKSLYLVRTALVFNMTILVIGTITSYGMFFVMAFPSIMFFTLLFFWNLQKLDEYHQSQRANLHMLDNAG